MKTLLTTTATALIISTAAFADAHATKSGMTTFEASDLIGMRVYSGDAASASDTWEDIGEINDLLVTMDGNVPSAVIGVGGLLGLGESDVKISLDQIQRVPGEEGEAFLVVGMSQEELEAMSPYEGIEETAMTTQTEVSETNSTDMAEADVLQGNPDLLDEETLETDVATAETGADMMGEREGFLASDLASLEANRLQGLTVYGAGDENIGEISELILGSGGEIDQFIIDVGGFIGIDEKPVAMSAAEVSFMEHAETEELRAYIQATEEQLEEMPAYEG